MVKLHDLYTVYACSLKRITVQYMPMERNESVRKVAGLRQSEMEHMRRLRKIAETAHHQAEMAMLSNAEAFPGLYDELVELPPDTDVTIEH